MFPTVAVVDVLDYLFAVLVGEVDVDVGHFVAFFRQEAFEEQLHADRVDGGYAERVADCGVGGGASALGEYAEFCGFVRNVPDD